MNDITHNPADIEHHLWDEIERRPVGMLMMTSGAPRHAQPMSAFAERESRRLWFFADAEAEIARSAGRDGESMFVYQHGDLYACIGGRTSVQHDSARIDKYWNAVISAWYPGGKNDPRLTMLCMDCDDAEVWLAATGPMKFVWEITKANATRRQPALGGHTHLTFH